MTPEQKQRLKDQMTAALDRAGDAAYQPVNPSLGLPGLTVREAILQSLESEQFYQGIDLGARFSGLLGKPTSVDQMIDEMTSDQAIQLQIQMFTGGIGGLGGNLPGIGGQLPGGFDIGKLGDLFNKISGGQGGLGDIFGGNQPRPEQPKPEAPKQEEPKQPKPPKKKPGGFDL